MLLLLLLLLLHGSLLLLVEGGRVTLARDGGYRGIVVNVGEDIPEEECAVLVENIKVTPSQVDIITITSPWWPHGHESKPGYPQQRQHCDSDNTAVLEANMLFFKPRPHPHI